MLALLWPWIANAVTTDNLGIVIHTSHVEDIALVPTRANMKGRELSPLAAKQLSQVRAQEASLYRPGEASAIEKKILETFPDAPVMLIVAYCESGVRTKTGCTGPINPNANNPNSTAYGVFQILEGTWRDHGCAGDRGNADDNIACARKVYDASVEAGYAGLRPWKASESGWSE